MQETAVFVAELGDKTQVTTLLYASDAVHSKLTVSTASEAALILASGLGVLAGSLVALYINPMAIRWVAGVGLVALGVRVLMDAVDVRGSPSKLEEAYVSYKFDHEWLRKRERLATLEQAYDPWSMFRSGTKCSVAWFWPSSLVVG